MKIKLLVFFCSQFKVHAASYYNSMCEMLMFDLRPELRGILRKFFLRAGTTFNITGQL